MRAEVTLQAMFDYYPNLYQERCECLNYLFIVTPNDFMWIDGQLVDKDLKAPTSKMGRKAQQYKQSEKGYDRAFRCSPRAVRWDDIKKESYILRYPHNIQKDWMKLISELRNMLKEDKIPIEVKKYES